MGVGNRHGLVYHRQMTMRVFLCECSQGIHFSSCVWVLERRPGVQDSLELIRFAYHALLKVWLIKVICQELAFARSVLRPRLSDNGLHQHLEIIPDESTAADYEFLATFRIVLARFIELCPQCWLLSETALHCRMGPVAFLAPH